MSYPYLFFTHPPYGIYPDYATATRSIREASKQECEDFVRVVWPHAYIYEHGPEWTVLPLEWRDRERIKKELPYVKIPGVLSMTVSWPDHAWRESDGTIHGASPEEMERRDFRMWKIAAATMIERAYTKELAESE